MLTAPGTLDTRSVYCASALSRWQHKTLNVAIVFYHYSDNKIRFICRRFYSSPGTSLHYNLKGKRFNLIIYVILLILCVCRRLRAGVRSASWMCLCVKRTATSGGKTARMISLARLTGTRDGTGAQVCTKRCNLYIIMCNFIL